MNNSIIQDNVKHLKFYEIVSRVIGIFLFILSTIYTVQLMQTFGNAGIQKFLFVIFGICMQASQLVCLAVGFLLTIFGKRNKAKFFFYSLRYSYVYVISRDHRIFQCKPESQSE